MNFGIDEDDVFKVAVVATMSSGKSTLINALIGADLLPSRNEACTAKTIGILDNDNATDFKAYLEFSDGCQKMVPITTLSDMEHINSGQDIAEVLIEGNIPGLRNIQKSTMIIDTPGINNSLDVNHRATTEKLLHSMKHGLIVYVINATQIGICDDHYLLSEIANIINSPENQLDILFIINKTDEIDFEKENLSSIVDNVRQYIECAGIKIPQIVPTSSLAAKLFKKVLSGCELTRHEKNDFNYLYDLFKPNDLSMISYAITKELSNQNDIIEGIRRGDLIRAIDNTGLTYVQDLIESSMLKHEEKAAPVPIIQSNEADTDAKDMIQTISMILKGIYQSY